jgi:hypothetical protein
MSFINLVILLLKKKEIQIRKGNRNEKAQMGTDRRNA